jgi:hypothetical protein
MMIAAGLSTVDVPGQALVPRWMIKDPNLTHFIVGNIWHLVNSGEECSVYEKLDKHETTLKAMAPEGQELVDHNTDAGWHLGQVFAETWKEYS